MKFISIKLKKNYTNYLRTLFLLLFSFFICYYFGFQGIIPLDDFVNLNSGYRVYEGDLPFKDYYEVTGPALSIIQALFFDIFGLSWKSYVLHSSIINCVTSIIIYKYFSSTLQNKDLSLIISILFSILFYPNNGVPGVDHHAWAFIIISLLLLDFGFEKKKFIYIFFSIFVFFLSFFIKQVPSAYIFILMCLIYLIHSISEKKVVYFFRIISTTLFFLICILILLNQNGIDFERVIEQYFLMLMNFGSGRVFKIDIYLIRENLSKIYFLFFLIFPTILLFFIKKKIFFNEKKIFLIIFFLILTSLFYETHTNNQAMTFSLIPIISGLIYQIQKNYKSNISLKYIYIFLIFLCVVKIIQFKINLIFYLIVVFIICFYYFKKKVLNFNLNFLLIIYLFITSFYYFELSVKSRKYKDISNERNLISFDGSKIDLFFKDLNWMMNNESSSEDFVNKKKNIAFLLNEIDGNYIFITDYQYYNLILNKKDFSPVKYWATGISYPSEENKLRENFENFFLDKLISNNVKYIVLDQNTTLFKENLLDYSFLSKCFEDKIVKDDLKLEIFKFKFNCFQG